MKRKFKRLFIVLMATLIVISGGLLYLFQQRQYFCISEDKCVTLWKTAEGAYIIPGKYTSWFKPKDNYIKTSNVGSLDIIWLSDKQIIANLDDNSMIVNKEDNLIKIFNYHEKEKEYSGRFTYIDGHYSRYKKNVNYISIDIKESYARTSDGRILR